MDGRTNRTKQLGRVRFVIVCLPLILLTSCTVKDHGELCDNALASAHTAFEKHDYANAQNLLQVAAKEAELSEAAVHKTRVLREQIAVALAQENPAEAEKFARTLVAFEKAQHQDDAALSHRFDIAEDTARADMLLGDCLRAEDKKQEALSVYKGALTQLKKCDIGLVLESIISARYTDTLKEVKGRATSLRADPEAQADAAFNLDGTLEDMYNMRHHQWWAQLIKAGTAAKKYARDANSATGLVTACSYCAYAEFMLGHTADAQRESQEAIREALASPSVASDNQAEPLIILALTDNNPEQITKHAQAALAVNSDEQFDLALIVRKSPLSRQDALFEREHQIELAMFPKLNDRRRSRLLDDMCLEYGMRKKYKEGEAWFKYMIGCNLLHAVELAQCDEKLAKLLDQAGRPDERERWIRKAIAAREDLTPGQRDQRSNLYGLAVDYEAFGEHDKAMALTTAALHATMDSAIAAAETHLLLGRLYQEKQQDDKALAEFDRVIACPRSGNEGSNAALADLQQSASKKKEAILKAEHRVQ